MQKLDRFLNENYGLNLLDEDDYDYAGIIFFGLSNNKRILRNQPDGFERWLGFARRAKCQKHGKSYQNLKVVKL